MRQLSDILKELIPKKGKSKSEVARLLGISSQLLGQYQRGGRKPGGDFFLKWRQVFGEDLLKLIETGVSSNGSAATDPLPGTVTLQDHIALWKARHEEAKADKDRLMGIIENNLTLLIKAVSKAEANLSQGQDEVKDWIDVKTKSVEQHLEALLQGLPGLEPLPGQELKEGIKAGGDQKNNVNKGKRSAQTGNK